MELCIKGKNALIVGASKGIGRAIAIGFAKEKANIVAVARTEDLMKEVKSEALSFGAESFEYVIEDIMACDTKAFAKDLIGSFGAFDIVIHNVGGSLISRDPLGGAEDWNYALKFNAVASIDMNSVLIPPMIEKGWGRVVQISSISAKMLRGNPLYASAKAFFMLMLSRWDALWLPRVLCLARLSRARYHLKVVIGISLLKRVIPELTIFYDITRRLTVSVRLRKLPVLFSLWQVRSVRLCRERLFP